MVRIGFVGWRGMVGSVLMDRMKAEGDFTGFEPLFFTTSQVGQQGPAIGFDVPPLVDAFDVETLAEMDVVVTCQGGGYSGDVYDKLRGAGWSGYWIDAASTLRMQENSIIVLDPVNRPVIDRGLSDGIKTYVGGNCTVSLMLMALAGLFNAGLIEWVSSMTYQSASGAGAKNMVELVQQMANLVDSVHEHISDPAADALAVDKLLTARLRDESFPTYNFGVPLAASLIPWIDRAMENGQSREEWKGYAETNKILGADPPIPVDGVCVRIGTMRCHSQGLTVKLKKDVPLDEITAILDAANDWVTVVPNEKDTTIHALSPAAVSGTLTIPIGRLRKMILGPEYLTAFTVGDQLLWGAAEPIRRILSIILEYLR